VFKRIDHVEIVPVDFERTLNFYTEIFGFKVQSRLKPEDPSIGEIAFIELGGTLIELFSVKEPTPASTERWQIGCRKIALEVDNLDKAIEYLKNKGVEISSSPVTVATLKRAEIKDPDGLSIELLQRL
jgi:glyoxylase I family protein